VDAICRIFEAICKPEVSAGVVYPADNTAEEIRFGPRAVVLRVDSRYGFYSKLVFRRGPCDSLDVIFSPNVDNTSPEERHLAQKAYEISDQFSRAVSNYFKNIDKK
jgi:hypothetical protein